MREDEAKGGQFLVTRHGPQCLLCHHRETVSTCSQTISALFVSFQYCETHCRMIRYHMLSSCHWQWTSDLNDASELLHL